MTPTTAAQPASRPAYSRAYLAWAMGLLLLIYTCNFIDRTIVSTLQEPIKHELKLEDWQMGLLGGIAFASLYAVMGIALARLAERRSRKTILSVSVVVWSLMTTLCGTAAGYGQLFLYRMGVGVGEAGAAPSSQSLISDYFPAERRATALSVFSLGVPLGSLLGAIAGGWIGQVYGWRQAFFIVGLPGVALGVLAQLTLREPPRGYSEHGTQAPLVADAADVAAPTATPGLLEVVRLLASRPSFLHVAAGGTLSAFAAYGIAGFTPPFLIRAFHVDLRTAGLATGLIYGASAGVGTLLGGVVTDAAGKRDKRWYVWAPAIGLTLAAPLYMLGYAGTAFVPALAVLLIPPVLHYIWLGPTYAVMHNMVSPRMRATATALLLLGLTVIGLGLGPLFVGALSDAFARSQFHGAMLDTQPFALACPGGRAPANSAPVLASACGRASAEGLRHAILVTCALYFWAAVHYGLAGRRLREDLAR